MASYIAWEHCWHIPYETRALTYVYFQFGKIEGIGNIDTHVAERENKFPGHRTLKKKAKSKKITKTQSEKEHEKEMRKGTN
jgi:hypothetical protein